MKTFTEDQYQQAIEIVRDLQRVNASILQRHLGIGYVLAAKIQDRMESEGLIGPARGVRPRFIFLEPNNFKMNQEQKWLAAECPKCGDRTSEEDLNKYGWCFMCNETKSW